MVVSSSKLSVRSSSDYETIRKTGYTHSGNSMHFSNAFLPGHDFLIRRVPRCVEIILSGWSQCGTLSCDISPEESRGVRWSYTLATGEEVSLVTSPCAPPGEKRSGERSRISWAYYPKVVRTNEIARSVIIMFTSLTTAKFVHHHSSIRTFLSGLSEKCFEHLGYTVAKECASPRNWTWFTRLFLLVRGWGLGMRLGGSIVIFSPPTQPGYTLSHFWRLFHLK